MGAAEGRHDGRGVSRPDKRDVVHRRRTGSSVWFVGEGEALGGYSRGSVDQAEWTGKEREKRPIQAVKVICHGARGVVQGRRVAADDALILSSGCSNCRRAAPSIRTGSAAVGWPRQPTLGHSRGMVSTSWPVDVGENTTQCPSASGRTATPCRTGGTVCLDKRASRGGYLTFVVF